MNHSQFCQIINSNFKNHVPEISNLISEYYFMQKITFEEYFLITGHRYLDFRRRFIIVDFDTILNGYYKNDIFVIHNENDQPAVISENLKIWVSHGNLHRDNDLPAYETDTQKSWFLNNELYKQYMKENDMLEYYDENDELHRNSDEHGMPQPAVIYSNGEKEYYNHGVRIGEYLNREYKFILTFSMFFASIFILSLKKR
jgi:hypothetical protein